MNNPALVAGSGTNQSPTPLSGGAVHFYHLTSSPLERALPKLLEKAYGAGFRTLVVAQEERIDRLNELLWTYDQDSFLPHGSARDGNEDAQPILLCSPAFIAGSGAEGRQTPPSGGAILCITNGQFAEHIEGYDRVLDIFDGGREESLQAARERWKRYKEAGCSLNYYQQTNTGGWDKR